MTVANATSQDFVVDLWGRKLNSGSGGTERDDNFTITLYNGSYLVGDLVQASGNLTITDDGDGVATHRLRTSFDLADGATFDRFEIRAANTPYFTIMETAAARFIPVPEPSSTALLGLAGLGIALRRRR